MEVMERSDNTSSTGEGGGVVNAFLEDFLHLFPHSNANENENANDSPSPDASPEVGHPCTQPFVLKKS